jgi:hypothetical protein
MTMVGLFLKERKRGHLRWGAHRDGNSIEMGRVEDFKMNRWPRVSDWEFVGEERKELEVKQGKVGLD